MRHVPWVLAALSALALWTAPADAEPPNAALRLYVAGQYAAAADIAQQESHSSESLAFAARAALAACVVGGDGEVMLQRAERNARAALALNPDSVDARLQLAVVYGMRGRRASLAEAFARNYAPRGRRLIDEALALAPASAEAEAVLGAWHLEIIRRSGRVGAITYGARVGEGIAAFERARTLAPDNAAIALQYALALAELDAAQHSERIGLLLNAIQELTPLDALEAYSQSVASRLATTMADQGPRAVALLAHAVMR